MPIARPTVRLAEYLGSETMIYSQLADGSEIAVKALRQKVTSQLRAPSRCRVTTPAVLHISVTSSINNTAREWLSFMQKSGVKRAAKRPGQSS